MSYKSHALGLPHYLLNTMLNIFVNYKLALCSVADYDISGLRQRYIAGLTVIQYEEKIPVSYTHLDVYKRQH